VIQINYLLVDYFSKNTKVLYNIINSFGWKIL